jgi:hypothetical protein
MRIAPAETGSTSQDSLTGFPVAASMADL